MAWKEVGSTENCLSEFGDALPWGTRDLVYLPCSPIDVPSLFYYNQSFINQSPLLQIEY